MDIRLERRTDYKEVEFLIREAFWNIYRPGCYEHYIIHNLRHDPSFINSLDYVVEVEEKIVAHIAYSYNKLINRDDEAVDVVTLGPLSVHPDYQGMGYATELVKYTLQKADNLGIPFVFVVGNPEFYQRFGFEDASVYGIQFNNVSDDTPFFMVKIFDKDKITSVNGIYRDNPCFKVDEKSLEEFDERFPPKQKEKREGQLDF